MKKLIALIAIVVLTTSFAFADGVPNVANVTVSCKAMNFTCQGANTFTISQVGVGSSGTGSGATTWLIDNYGTSGNGTFLNSPMTNLWSVTTVPTPGGNATDLTIEPLSGNGWSYTGIDWVTDKWKMHNPNCGAQATLTFSYKITATPSAVPGLYVVTFTENFTTY